MNLPSHELLLAVPGLAAGAAGAAARGLAGRCTCQGRSSAAGGPCQCFGWVVLFGAGGLAQDDHAVAKSEATAHACISSATCTHSAFLPAPLMCPTDCAAHNDRAPPQGGGGGAAVHGAGRIGSVQPGSAGVGGQLLLFTQGVDLVCLRLLELTESYPSKPWKCRWVCFIACLAGPAVSIVILQLWGMHVRVVPPWYRWMQVPNSRQRCCNPVIKVVHPLLAAPPDGSH